MKKKIICLLLICITIAFIFLAYRERGYFAIGGEVMPLMFIPIVLTSQKGRNQRYE